MAGNGTGDGMKKTEEKKGIEREKMPPKTASSYINLTVRRDDYRRRPHFV